MARPTSREKHPLSVALINLRKALGETQQQFAARLGTAITTVARYETSHPPSGAVLQKLALIALDAGLEDLEDLFAREAMAQTEFFVRMNNAEEFAFCTAVLRILRSDKNERQRASLNKVIAPVLNELYAADPDPPMGLQVSTTPEGAKIFDLARLRNERHDNKTTSKKRKR